MQAIGSLTLIVCITINFGVFLPEVSGRRECIDQLIDLETSLLSNQGNIENLTKAFIPVNQPSPLVVRACYYVQPANNMTSEDCQNATYIFRWSSSPIFLYAPVNTLKALTLNLAQITQQTAVLTIDAPVCDILLLNYLSTLLRAYVSVRNAEEIDPSLVGSVAFYDASQDDFFLLVGDTDLGQTPLVLTFSGTLLVLCAAFGVPMAIYAAYDGSVLGESQSSIKYFIGGFALVLCFAVPVAVGYDIYNIRSLDGIIQSEWIKFFTVSGGSAVVVYGFIAGFVIAYLNRETWKIPRKYKFVSIIVQTLGIGLTVTFSALMAFHGLFIVFFLLLTSSPQHITVSIVFYGASFFSCVVITALFLVSLVNRYKNHFASSAENDAGNSRSSTNKQKCYTCLTTSYLISFFILVYLFLAAFVYGFSQFIPFSNSGADGGSYIATLTPSLLLTVMGIVLTFVLKKQTSLHDGIAKEDTQEDASRNSKSD